MTQKLFPHLTCREEGFQCLNCCSDGQLNSVCCPVTVYKGSLTALATQLNPGAILLPVPFMSALERDVFHFLPFWAVCLGHAQL